jgi:hypothetical protein
MSTAKAKTGSFSRLVNWPIPISKFPRSSS